MFCLLKCSNSWSFRLQSLYFLLFWSDIKSSRRDFLFESSGVLCRARSPVSIAQKKFILPTLAVLYSFLSPPFCLWKISEKEASSILSYAHSDSWISVLSPSLKQQQSCLLTSVSQSWVCFLWCELCLFSATWTYLCTYGKDKCSKSWNF